MESRLPIDPGVPPSSQLSLSLLVTASAPCCHCEAASAPMGGEGPGGGKGGDEASA